MDYRILNPREFELPRIGHSGFFRAAGEARLWPLVRDWLVDTARRPAPRGMPSPSGPV